MLVSRFFYKHRVPRGVLQLDGRGFIVKDSLPEPPPNISCKSRGPQIRQVPQPRTTSFSNEQFASLPPCIPRPSIQSLCCPLLFSSRRPPVLISQLLATSRPQTSSHSTCLLPCSTTSIISISLVVISQWRSTW